MHGSEYKFTSLIRKKTKYCLDICIKLSDVSNLKIDYLILKLLEMLFLPSIKIIKLIHYIYLGFIRTRILVKLGLKDFYYALSNQKLVMIKIKLIKLLPFRKINFYIRDYQKQDS